MDAIEDDYQAGIVRGVLRASTQANVQLWCVAGGVVGDGDKDVRSQRNFLFDLVDASAFDGFIVLSGALGNQIGVQRFADWTARFDKPLVNLGVDVPGRHSISVDGGAGMHEVVTHLIKVHDRRRIAFIRGPTTSQEAEERYAAYRAALAGNGIELDERLVLQGTWLRESGADAVRTLFDERGVRVDSVGAIASANDYMALGALDELQQREIVVPETIALTGFDDLDTLSGVVPALTTVRQPTEELGAAGFQRLLSLMNQASEPVASKLVPQLVERRSCGCSRSPASHLVKRLDIRARSFETALVERRAVLCAELSRGARGALYGVGSGWENRLFTAFLADVTGHESSAFVSVINGISSKLQRSGGDPAILRSVLGHLRQGVYDCAGGDVVALTRAAELFEAARETVADFSLRSEVSRRVAVLHQLREFSAMVSLLLSAPPPELLQAAFAQRFGALGLGAFVLGLFTRSGEVTEDCLCLAAFNDGGRLPAPRQFRARQLLPRELFAGEKRPLLLQPLVFDGKPLGLVVSVLGSLDTNVYEQLRETMSAGVQGYRLASSTVG